MATGRKAGSSVAQRAKASGQRARNRQPAPGRESSPRSGAARDPAPVGGFPPVQLRRLVPGKVEKGRQIGRRHGGQHGNALADCQRDEVAKAPARRLLLAELVDDQQIGAERQPAGDPRHRAFKRIAVQPAALRPAAERLRDDDGRPPCAKDRQFDIAAGTGLPLVRLDGAGKFHPVGHQGHGDFRHAPVVIVPAVVDDVTQHDADAMRRPAMRQASCGRRPHDRLHRGRCPFMLG